MEVSWIRPRDLNEFVLKVKGKGRKAYDQEVIIRAESARLLRLQISRLHPEKNQWAFPGYKDQHITTRTIRRIWDDLRECAGIKIDKRAAHIARHTYARNAVEKGQSIQSIKKHLRHRKAETTLHYIMKSKVIE